MTTITKTYSQQVEPVALTRHPQVDDFFNPTQSYAPIFRFNAMVSQERRLQHCVQRNAAIL